VHTASFGAPGDEIVVTQPDRDRGIEIIAPQREIRDQRGHLWTLREKRLAHAWTARDLMPKTLARAARGWLVFENGMRRVVVTPPPDRWQEWDDAALLRLLERRAPRRRLHRRTTDAAGA